VKPTEIRFSSRRRLPLLPLGVAAPAPVGAVRAGSQPTRSGGLARNRRPHPLALGRGKRVFPATGLDCRFGLAKASAAA